MPEADVPFAPAPEARMYALKELARRAGVTSEFFHSWKIQITADRTSISLAAGHPPRIHIEHASPRLLTRLASGDFPVSFAGWLSSPPSACESSLVIPFSDLPASPAQPLFLPRENSSFVCRADLLLSILFTLCRAEESICTTRDEHGRFPASASVASLHNFLERPIVDEYGLAFEEILAALLPSWKPARPPFRVNLTHDIDGVGIPFNFRTTIGHTAKRNSPAATARDFLALVSSGEPAELFLVRKLAAISKTRGFHSAFFWKGSARTPMDEGYDPFHPQVQRVLNDLRNDGFELGIHPGYNTFHSRGELATEVARLRSALSVNRPGGRQHYLRWSPETWLDWEACNLYYDSSVGFADRFGFRAGTSVPYCPWSISQNRELNLIEVPLILMDCTPVKYMGLSRVSGLERIRQCLKRTERVGGVFTILWHNTPLIEPEYKGWYESVLDLLPPSQSLQLPAASNSLW